MVGYSVFDLVVIEQYEIIFNIPIHVYRFHCKHNHTPHLYYNVIVPFRIGAPSFPIEVKHLTVWMGG